MRFRSTLRHHAASGYHLLMCAGARLEALWSGFLFVHLAYETCRAAAGVHHDPLDGSHLQTQGASQSPQRTGQARIQGSSVISQLELVARVAQYILLLALLCETDAPVFACPMVAEEVKTRMVDGRATGKSFQHTRVAW